MFFAISGALSALSKKCTICLAGAIIYLIGHTLELDPTVNFLLSAGTITLIRLPVIRKGWSLPRIDNQ